MLGKLLKHDMRAQMRVILPVTICVMISAILCTGALRLAFVLSDITAEPEGFAAVLSTIFMSWVVLFVILNVFILLVYPTIALISIVVHFYRNLYTDEGYLTFTLPVKTRSILTSKFISGMIWQLVSYIVLIALGAFILIFGTSPEHIVNLSGIRSFFDVVGMILGEYGWLAFTYLISLLAGSFYGIAALYLAVTIGCVVAKKHRVLASIGVYYVINMIMSTMMSVVSFIIVAVATAMNESAALYVSSIVSAAFSIVFTVAALLITVYMMKNKLNLS